MATITHSENETTKTASNTQETVDPSIKCCICLEVYNDPRVLPCLHTFCLLCLQTLSKDKEILSCPQCRDKHTIPTTGVNSYPLNTSILSEIENVRGKEEEGGLNKSCGFCRIKVNVSSYCDDCGEYLCDTCRDGIHQTGKVLINHRVRKIGKKHHTYKPPPAVSSFCIHHPSYRLEVYCRDCTSIICCKCAVSYHNKHNYEELTEDGMLEVEEEICSLTEKTINKEKILKASLEFVENVEKVVLAQQDELRAKIKAFVDLLIEMTEAKFTEDNKKIWATKNNIETRLSQIESSRSFTSYLQLQTLVNKMDNLLLIDQVLQSLVKFTKTDKPTEEIWTLASTSITYQKDLHKIIDFTRLSVLCSEEEKKVYGRSQNLIYPTEVPQYRFDIQNPCITGYRNYKAYSYKGVDHVKVCVTLEHPFAYCTEWTCKSIDSHASPFGRNMNSMMSFFVGNVDPHVSPPLEPINCVPISNRVIQIRVTKEYGRVIGNQRYYNLLLSPTSDTHPSLSIAFPVWVG